MQTYFRPPHTFLLVFFCICNKNNNNNPQIGVSSRAVQGERVQYRGGLLTPKKVSMGNTGTEPDPAGGGAPVCQPKQPQKV